MFFQAEDFAFSEAKNKTLIKYFLLYIYISRNPITCDGFWKIVYCSCVKCRYQVKSFKKKYSCQIFSKFTLKALYLKIVKADPRVLLC